jgi:hypothetical protein
MTDSVVNPSQEESAPRIVVTTQADIEQHALDLLPKPEVEEPAQSGVESESESPADVDEPDEPEQHKPSKGVQKRIDELVRAREEARREVAETKTMLAKQQELLERALGGKQEPESPRQPVYDSDEPPNINDFKTIGEYLVARDQYSDRRLVQERERIFQEFQAQKQRESLISKEVEYAKAMPDYAAAKQALIENPEIFHHPGLGAMVAGLDNTFDVIRYLGNNIDEAKSLVGLEPVELAMKLGRIAERASAKTAPAPAPATKAPPPPTPIGSAGKPVGFNDLDAAVESGDTDRYRRIRNAQWDAKRLGQK